MDWSLDNNEYDDDRNKKQSLMISIGLHLLLLLLCLLPWGTDIKPPNEFQGVLVVFGNPDEGGNDSAQLVEEDSQAEFVEVEEQKKKKSEKNSLEKNKKQKRRRRLKPKRKRKML